MLYAQTLGFNSITTPAYSPESNGMAEAFDAATKCVIQVLPHDPRIAESPAHQHSVTGHILGDGSES